MKNVHIGMRVMLAAGLLCATAAQGASTEVFSARLAGDSEVPPTSSAASGVLRIVIDNSTATPAINFTLTFDNLSGNPTASHLHFAQANVAGGVMIFLCGGGGQPACPSATSGTITGTITAANVTGPTAQGISAGGLAAALEAVQDGLSYVNIHDAMFPSGEIRGQLRRGDRGHDRE